MAEYTEEDCEAFVEVFIAIVKDIVDDKKVNLAPFMRGLERLVSSK